MRILVTGGAGYIGSATVKDLLSAGHEVVVLDTLERGHRESVDPRATLVEGDVGDSAIVSRALDGCDAVMHLAGYIEVAESQAHPGRYFDNNVARPRVMLDAMVDAGVKAIVFSSTAAVYGEPETVPILETADKHPINAYGASKLMFEQMLSWYESIHSMRSIRLRYFNVAGAWPDGSMGEAHDPETHIIPRLLKAVAGGRAEFEVFGSDYPTRDGTCVRDYIHVCDLAEAHRLGLEALGGGHDGGAFNLGNGEGFTNLDVVRTCGEVVGREIDVTLGPRRPGDPAALVASSERVSAELGWKAKHPELKGIIEDAWVWHESHPNGYNS